jgi:hypothetical protein
MLPDMCRPFSAISPRLSWMCHHALSRYRAQMVGRKQPRHPEGRQQASSFDPLERETSIDDEHGMLTATIVNRSDVG